MKYKTGQKVKIKEVPEGLKDDYQVGDICEIVGHDNIHYKVETKDGEDWYYFGEHQLSPLEKDWDTLEVGDELVDGDGLTITEMYDKVRKEVEETFVRAFPIKTDIINGVVVEFCEDYANRQRKTYTRFEINGREYIAKQIHQTLEALSDGELFDLSSEA